MSWIAAAIGGGALIGGATSLIGSAVANKNRAKPGNIPQYNGPRSRSANPAYTGPIENMISETLMRRSQGQDVGFDPKRAAELKSIYDIDYNRQQTQNKNDIMNQLSGTGQSRNLAARDALLGKSQRWAEDTRSKYNMGVDVEDLTRRADDTKDYTRMLQDQNKFNFNQDNQVANFGLDEARYNSGAISGNYDMQNQYAQQYQDPMASGIAGAGNGAITGASMYTALKGKAGGISPQGGGTPTFGVSGDQSQASLGQTGRLKNSPLYNLKTM